MMLMMVFFCVTMYALKLLNSETQNDCSHYVATFCALDFEYIQ